MQLIMLTRGSLTALALCLLAALGAQSAHAKTLGEQGRTVVPACDTSNTPNVYCGAIVYGNAGGYVVKNEAIEAESKQPSGVTLHPKCSGTKVRFAFDTSLGQYNTAVLPANCAYKLKINIAGGRKKTRDLYLTPGCLIEMKTDGTTLQNEWHMKVMWIKGKKPANGPKTPMDGQGNKCGLLKKM